MPLTLQPCFRTVHCISRVVVRRYDMDKSGSMDTTELPDFASNFLYELSGTGLLDTAAVAAETEELVKDSIRDLQAQLEREKERGLRGDLEWDVEQVAMWLHLLLKEANRTVADNEWQWANAKFKEPLILSVGHILRHKKRGTAFIEVIYEKKRKTRTGESKFYETIYGLRFLSGGYHEYNRFSWQVVMARRTWSTRPSASTCTSNVRKTSWLPLTLPTIQRTGMRIFSALKEPYSTLCL